MIHDAKVEVTCDGEGCSESVEIEPEYVYRDYSGKNGYYDCSSSAIERKLAREGWVVRESGDGGDNMHYCESCSEHMS